MMRSLFNATQGLMAGQARVETAAHNLANLATPGFKAHYIQGSDMGYHTWPGDVPAPRGVLPLHMIQMGHGAGILATRRDMTQGVLQSTDGPLDLALDGAGFFQLEGPAGEIIYSRDGSFRLDDHGRITSPDGLYLMGEDGLLPPVQSGGQLVILPGGQIEVHTGDDRKVLGQLAVAIFAHPDGLFPTAGNSYRATTDSGLPQSMRPGTGEAGMVRQGHLEQPNTELAVEMVSTLIARRAYEMNARAIRAVDDMWRQANEIKA